MSLFRIYEILVLDIKEDLNYEDVQGFLITAILSKDVTFGVY